MYESPIVPHGKTPEEYNRSLAGFYNNMINMPAIGQPIQTNESRNYYRNILNSTLDNISKNKEKENIDISNLDDYASLYGLAGIAGDIANTTLNNIIAENASSIPTIAAAYTGNTWGDYLYNSKKINEGIQTEKNLTQDFSDVKNNYNLENVWNQNEQRSLMNPLFKQNNITQAASDFSSVIGDMGKGAAIGSAIGPAGTIVGAGIGALSGVVRSGINNIQNRNNYTAMQYADDNRVKNNVYNYSDRMMLNDQINQRRNSYNIFETGGYLPEGNGVDVFNVGSTHQQNPYGGIQQGIASDGKPNYVEEGEVKYNDYIFSARNKLSDKLISKYNLPNKYNGKSFADIAKELQKYSENFPNDSIGKQTLDEMMSRLAKAQEEYNYLKEQRKLTKLFNSLPDEQKLGLMQMVMQQSNEQGMYDQQMQQENVNPDIEQYAYGGSIHIAPSKKGTFTAAATKHGMSVQEFANKVLANKDDYSTAMIRKANFARNASHWHQNGGKEEILNALGIRTQSELNNWLQSNNLGENVFDNLKDDNLINAIRIKNPALADAMSKGYDFGEYQASKKPAYNWGDFLTEENTNSTSKLPGGSRSRYKIDKTLSRDEVIALEKEQSYKDFTNYILSDETPIDEKIRYFRWLDDNTGNKDEKYLIRPHRLRDDWKDVFKRKRFKDHLYGINHYTPKLLDRTNQVINYLVNDDGSIEEILTDPDNAWSNIGSYSWSNPESDITYNYYKAQPNLTEEEIERLKELPESLRDDLLRKAPLIGAGIQSLASLAPTDFTYSNELNRLAGEFNPIATPPLGGYRRYNPYDVNLTNNQNMAQLASMQRTNRENANRWNQTAANIGVFNAAANQNAFNNLAWQQANEKNRLDTDVYNLGIDQFNLNNVREYDKMNSVIDSQRIGMLANAAQAADAATTLTSTNRSNSITNFLNNLGNYGKENVYFNLVNKAINDKVLKGVNFTYDKDIFKQDGGVIGHKEKFVRSHYNSWYNYLKSQGVKDPDLLAQRFALQDSLESGYGTSDAASGHNYGGMQHKGKNIVYNNDNDYFNAKWQMMQEKFPNALNAASDDDFYKALRDKHAGYLYHKKGKSYDNEMRNMISARRWLNKEVIARQNRK